METKKQEVDEEEKMQRTKPITEGHQGDLGVEDIK